MLRINALAASSRPLLHTSRGQWAAAISAAGLATLSPTLVLTLDRQWLSDRGSVHFDAWPGDIVLRKCVFKFCLGRFALFGLLQARAAEISTRKLEVCPVSLQTCSLD